MGRKELHDERRASEEAASSRGPSGGRKALVVGDDGSGRCGICSAHVAVRGVLDCCSHEYCFDCIENWSSVSNLCPLCKLQFRFISVENVHDQESDIVENLSSFPVKREREEESWDNEVGLPFSFPSFFIDEDAVACLEGNRCLIRAGVPLQDEDAADTSVACDSCDRWYHAGCVGFDPSISWGSWLCPRCSEKAAALRPPPTISLPPITTAVSSPILPITTVVSSFTSGRVPVAELAYNATVFSEGGPTVSISVVDEGESALMLSTCRPAEFTILSPGNRKISTFSDGKRPDPRGQASVVVKSEEITYGPLEDKATGSQEPGPSALEKLSIEGQKPVPSVPSISKPEINNSMGADCDPVDRRPKEAIYAPPVSVLSAKAEQHDVALLPLQTLQSLQSEEPKNDQGNESVLELGVAANADLPASYFDNVEFEEQPRKEKRKQSTRQDRDIIRAEDLPEPPRKIARSAVKKIDTGKGSTSGPPLEKTDAHSPKDSRVNETLPSVEKQVDEEIRFTEDVHVEDLVHIVKDERVVGTGVVKDEHTGGIGSNSAGGVRTRVVIRRESDGRAAQIVEDIRRQMRAAAGYGAADDHGKVAVSDDRFFSAFKAAMVRNQEQNQGVKIHGLKRRRNSWLDKMLDKAPRGKAGGVRESLTKKLYAGGVSRKTWDRDWDISFWKEQSARIKKAKQEASDVVEGRSGVRVKEEVVKDDVVLQKLKNIDTEGDSILSRLYVADTSLFPRDNDIKPLISLLGDVKEEGKPKCERAIPKPKSLKSQTSMGRKSAETKPNRAGGASTNGIVIPSPQGLKVPSCDSSGKTSKGTMKVSGLPGTHKHVDASKASGAPDPEEKKDKRLWALELLARRSGDAVTSSSAKCQGGAKSSLLGQVPEALRPTLPPDRRSRVPTAVRQSQLNRILEHYLRKAKLTNLQGGYKVKSVIASAVAKELEIYESSNSKGVYVNLCVRALAQQDEVRLQVAIPEPGPADGAAAIAEALLATGLISDSPPASPRENHNANTEIGRTPPNNQGPEDLREVSVSSLMLTGSTGSAENYLSKFSDSINPSYSHAGDVENVLDISQPVSSDIFDETDLVLEVRDCEGNIASSAQPASPRNKMKVVLSKRNNPPEVPANNEKNPEDSSAGREGTVPAVSPSSQEGKSLDVLVDSTTNDEHHFSNGQKMNETSKLAKIGNEFALVPGKDKSGALNTNKVELESKLGGAAPVRSSGESDGDDWMNTGKFPDLDSRIDKMRKDVLKMSSSFLSQFGEEHIFGGSFQEPTSTNEVRLGKAIEPSSDASIPNRNANESNPGRKEAEPSTAVQKQVEAYVKEHLKPLYKSGVIKSDQFRYAVSKTASKVMQHHDAATSADFLIVEGSKVKKLADQYLQSYVQKK